VFWLKEVKEFIFLGFFLFLLIETAAACETAEALKLLGILVEVCLIMGLKNN
jgi:hypothetical protein